eukprot:gene8288-9138_t
MSRGKAETTLLKENIEDQLKRLLTQLADVEQMKDELDEEEYQTTRKETIEQLEEFEQSLKKMLTGNMTLIDQVNAAQLAIQTAIRNADSAEILKMFVKKENGSLRTKLSQLESDHRLGRITRDIYETQAADIIGLLDKLKEPLTPAERQLLEKNRKDLDNYESANVEIDGQVMKDAAHDLNQKST